LIVELRVFLQLIAIKQFNNFSMVLPIVAYGSQVLRKVAADITPDYQGISELISDMWETMYSSSGVGLAAPQINKSIRLFVVDSEQIFRQMEADKEKSSYPDAPGIKQAFINAHIKEIDGEEWAYNEGCLSIPKIREDVKRNAIVTLEYMDENFQQCQRTFQGLTARIILHEYDHIEGKLFIDHISPFKRKLMKGKLNDITKGNIKVDYKMSFPG
jgi:peptide deformylase